MNLVGKEITLSVDEPWDYTSADGTKLIAARVVAFYEERRIKRLVAEAKREVVVRGKAQGTRLILEARHREGDLSDIALGKRVIVGVAIVPSGKSDEAAIYAIIGDVYLKGHESGAISGFE